MKNIFRVIGFAVAVVVFSAVNGFAQGSPCEDAYEVKDGEYKKFREAIKGNLTLVKAKSALEIGNNFVTKYAACEDTKPVVDYINGKIPAIKQYIVETERNEKFNNGVKNKNWNDAFSAGKEIVAAEADKPISLNVALVLAQIGYDRTLEKNNTFNNDAIMMAETAIKKMEAGVTSDRYGAFTIYELKNKDFADGKQNALGWMNYIIGYIKAVPQDKKKEALPYFYAAATKYNSAVKNFADLYQILGIYYFTEVQKIDKERVRLFEANNKQENAETLAMWDLEKGYFDRAIDAYARAYKIAMANETAAPAAKKPAAKAYKDQLYKDLEGLYKERFNKTEGLDEHIAAQTAKPLPDPTTEVQPVKEEIPTTTSTTSSTTTTTTTKPTTNTTTKPSTNTTTPTNNTTTPAKPTSNQTTTKPNSSTTTPKKPVTKKKSGR